MDLWVLSLILTNIYLIYYEVSGHNLAIILVLVRSVLLQLGLCNWPMLTGTFVDRLSS